MKFIAAGIVIVIAFFFYKFYTSEHNAASGNTVPDDKKNVNILNPQATNGVIVQTDGPNTNNLENLTQKFLGVPSAIYKIGFTGTNLDGSVADKALLSNDNSISNVATVRQDSVNPLLVASDIGKVPIAISGSRFGDNLADPSLQLEIPIPVIQNWYPLPPTARVNDNFIPQLTALVDEPLIPILARAG